MNWTVEDRDNAIRSCEPTFKDDGKQCMNCKSGSDCGEYMALSCDTWCARVEYDEVCYKHEARSNP
jgi:hypothetical protein